jgi:sigma-E factor negative regulatory protein RseA
MIEQHASTMQAGAGLAQKVSDLMDGRLTPQEAAQALDEEQLQETWGVYHLIGDVLRSPDLAACSGTAALVERLRVQLPQARQELAALPLEAAAAATGEGARARAANDPVFRWKMVAGVACCTAAALWGWGAWNGQGGPQGERAQLAQAVAPAPVVAQASAPQAVASVQAVALADDEAAPVMLRDARLDALLAAHWQSSRGASALGNAQGFLRSAAYEEADR